jgi:hypothetical protein
MSDQRVRGFPHGQRHRLEDGCGNQRGPTNLHHPIRADGKATGLRESHAFTERIAKGTGRN